MPVTTDVADESWMLVPKQSTTISKVSGTFSEKRKKLIDPAKVVPLPIKVRDGRDGYLARYAETKVGSGSL